MGSRDWVRAATTPAAREILLAEAREQGGEAVAASVADAKGERLLLFARAFAHPRDARIRFHEASHKYFLDGRQMPLSVSGFWARYFDHFDAPRVLRDNLPKWRRTPGSKYHAFLAALRSVDVPDERHAEIIQAAWSLNGSYKSALGTSMHRAIEMTINEEEVECRCFHGVDDDQPETPTERALLPFLQGLFDLPPALAAWMLSYAHDPTLQPPAVEVPPRADTVEFAQYRAWRDAHPELLPVRQEMNVYSEEHQLAGQLDALYWDSGAKRWALVDWKRVKEMKTQPDHWTRKGLPPFEDVLDTNAGHYACAPRE
jgi:hypothetical protein